MKRLAPSALHFAPLLALGLFAQTAQTARAQDDGDAGDEVPSVEDSGTVDDADATAEEDAASWAQPRLLVLGERGTPAYVVRALRQLLASAGEIVPADAYVSAAREAGLAAVSVEAFERLLGAQDVVLVVVISAPRRTRLARVSYREGRSGLVLLDERHPIDAGGRLDETASRTVLAETRLAVAALTRPGEGRALAQESAGDAEPLAEDDLTGTRVRFALGVGAGIGTRSFDGPPAVGRLATDPYPAVMLMLGIGVEPDAGAQLSITGRIRYFTSAGLRTTDVRLDGTSRVTASRTQSIAIDLGLGYRLGQSLEAATLEAALGFSSRAFSSNALVSLPDYGLGGPYARIGASLPFAKRFSIAVGADLQWLAAVADVLQGLGAGAGGLAFGFEARFSASLIDELALEATYREAHAMVSDGSAGGATDVERWVVLAAVYRR